MYVMSLTEGSDAFSPIVFKKSTHILHWAEEDFLFTAHSKYF